MKSTIITILLALVALTGLAQKNNYTVSGDLSTLFKGTSYVVKYDSVYILNDSTRIIRKGQKQQIFAVKDGKFEISGIATDAYGITGIPEIILFGPDGTILARSLRGNQIEMKLAEVFSNKK